jgi:hypothetical protein
MIPRSDNHGDPQNIEAFLDILRETGRETGRVFRRVVINDDGSGEAEYEARNPWECLVIPFANVAGALRRSPQGLDGDTFLEKAVIRKKCTKCFLHQREVVTADLSCSQESSGTNQ